MRNTIKTTWAQFHSIRDAGYHTVINLLPDTKATIFEVIKWHHRTG